MMTKLQLERRTQLAWNRAILKNPELKAEHGEDGFKVFSAHVYKLGQEDIARLFDVSYRTSQRWHEEFKRMAAAA
jgi:hypothetical protein